MLKHYWRYGFSVILCMIIFVAGTAAALAVSDVNGDYKVTFNGQKMAFDQDPININDRILVPMRPIFEAYGADIEWDQDYLEVTATTDEKEIILAVDSKYAYINGEKTKMETPAALVNGRTMVPVRFVSEALDADVEWDGRTSTVVITADVVEKPAPAPSAPVVSQPAPAPVNPAPANPAPTNPAPAPTNPAPQQPSAVNPGISNISNPAGFFSTQQGISGACYLTCLGMVSSNLNGTEIYASQVYAMNGNTVQQNDYWGLLKKLNMTRTDYITLTGKTSAEKVNTVVSLLKNNPEGVILKFQAPAGNTHFIVCKGYSNGMLVVNDPVGQKYVTLDKCWTGYSMCGSYDKAIDCMIRVEAYNKL